MTTTQAPAAPDAASSSPSPSQAFGTALNAVVGTVASRLERTTAGWIEKLEGIAGKESSDAISGMAEEGLDAAAESGGVTQQAGAAGVKAHLQGRSPAWAALRGVWRAGSPAVRAAVVTATVGGVVLLLLSPALLLVYLLSWLILAAIHQAQQRTQQRAQTTRRRRPATA